MRVIDTERLVLRPWEEQDADFLLDLEGRWEVVRYLGPDPATRDTREEALASIARRRATSEHPVHGIWLIAGRDGRPLGNLLLKPVPLSRGEEPADPAETEIGWHLHPDAWGRGYATEAARVVLRDARTRGLARVVAVVHPDNHASQAVCRRIGMTHRGPTDRYMDAVLELYESVG